MQDMLNTPWATRAVPVSKSFEASLVTVYKGSGHSQPTSDNPLCEHQHPDSCFPFLISTPGFSGVPYFWQVWQGPQKALCPKGTVNHGVRRNSPADQAAVEEDT